MKAKNLTWGIFFILMAAFVILASMDVFGDISVWTCIFAGFCVMWLINGIVKISFGNILFPLSFLAILFDEVLGIEEITPWPVLMAALFGTIGLNMIFGNRKKKKAKEHNGGIYYGPKKGVEESTQSDEHFNCELAFGSTVKYVKCQNLKLAKIENSFGNASIYFDGARLGGAQATVSIENSFGKTTLFIPKEWNVSVNVSRAFGNVSENGQCTPDSANTLMVVGEVSFGNIEITYV